MHDSNRLTRFTGRHTLRSITTVERCYDCGRATVTGGCVVGIRRTDAGIVGIAGVATCGRVWLCPVCNSKVMARRAVEIGAALTWAAVEGLHVIWGSLTVHHTVRSPLGLLIGLQQDAWRHVVQSRFWSRASATATRAHACSQACESSCERKRDTYDTGKNGRVGYIRASETTIGSNGWHPHFHPIILWRGTAAEAQDFADDVVGAWCDGVAKAGGFAERNGAQQLRVISGVQVYDELARYVTKATYDPKKLALETVWSQSKTGRGRAKETVSHWSLLAAVEQGLADEVGLWHELEDATTGHRMITWSRGLRAFAGLSVDEVDDADVAAEEVGTRDDTVAVLTSEGWSMVRDRPDILAMMLDQLESAGMPGLVAVLDLFGVPWLTVDELADVENDAHSDFYDDRRQDERESSSMGWAPARS